jgi:hypothetical protein
MNLPERFKKRDRGGGGKVQAAFFRNLGNADEMPGVLGADGFWDSRGFGAEDEPVVFGE